VSEIPVTRWLMQLNTMSGFLKNALLPEGE
jgi:hypothetical protein